MKKNLIAIALFAATAVAIAGYPMIKGRLGANTAGELPDSNVSTLLDKVNRSPQVDVVFVLDTTGSMGGLIAAAKEKIWSIASTLAQAEPAPEIRIGLVAYRDRGDAYVTRVVDLSNDLDSMYATLMDFQAQGGGDGPESVNQALYDAVHKMAWSTEQNVYRAVFLVGDAAPHMDYQNDVKYPETIAYAKQRGIVINAVQCGTQQDTRTVWQSIAQSGAGRYVQVDQAGSAVAVATPYDEAIARLSSALDETRLFYGDAETRKAQESKVAATKKLGAASVQARARRGIFNTSASGKSNFVGEQELVDAVQDGRVDLAAVPAPHLPAELQSMEPEARSAYVKQQAQKRVELKRQIRELADRRAEHVAQKIEEAGGARASLDDKLFDAVKAQASEIGLTYDADAPSY